MSPAEFSLEVYTSLKRRKIKPIEKNSEKEHEAQKEEETIIRRSQRTRKPSNVSSIDTTIRRSQRVRKPSNFAKRWEWMQANFRRFQQNAEKRKAAQLKKSLKENSKSKANSDFIPAASSTPNPQRSTLKSRSRKMKTDVLPEIAEIPNESTAEDGQMSKTQNGLPETTKELRVRIRRHREDAENNSSLESPPEISSSTSSRSKHPEISNTAKSTSFNFKGFLTNSSNAPNLSNSGSQSFRGMSLSSLSDLEFKPLKNVDYAFYTEEENSIGYIRLQPGQMEPPCTVKNPSDKPRPHINIYDTNRCFGGSRSMCECESCFRGLSAKEKKICMPYYILFWIQKMPVNLIGSWDIGTSSSCVAVNEWINEWYSIIGKTQPTSLLRVFLNAKGLYTALSLYADSYDSCPVK